MPEYRAYFVGDDDDFTGFEGFTSSDDTEATEKAKCLVDGHDVELWSGSRLVVVLRHLHGPSVEVRALNRQINETERMSTDAKDKTAKARMDKLTGDLTQERDAQQRRDDEM